jgi:hypothetical protein
MLKVINHETGAIMAYDTISEALAAGRFLADQLAAAQSLRVTRVFIEQVGLGELLIAGEFQASNDEAPNYVPLVWVVAELPPQLG